MRKIGVVAAGGGAPGMNAAAPKEERLGEQKKAYFPMEIALSDDIHTYSGGLGVLAGDTIRSSADLKLPLVGVTLISKKGYFRQELTLEGRQIEHPDPWEPLE